MTEVTAISAQAAALLVHYGFDLGGKKAEKLAGEWLTKYPGYWLRLAVVEALYQGRYKAVSVGQLLSMWHRIGEPLYHFNREFERLVCNNFPQDLTSEKDAGERPDPGRDPVSVAVGDAEKKRNGLQGQRPRVVRHQIDGPVLRQIVE